MANLSLDFRFCHPVFSVCCFNCQIDQEFTKQKGLMIYRQLSLKISYHTFEFKLGAPESTKIRRLLLEHVGEIYNPINMMQYQHINVLYYLQRIIYNKYSLATTYVVCEGHVKDAKGRFFSFFKKLNISIAC